VRYAQWVFDCDAPLDEFARRMRASLERRGFATGPAQVHDFSVARGGARAYVKLVYHDWGIQVVAKLKTGWFGNGAVLERAIWESAREAQLQVAGWRPATS
jgi:hypothetical protein